jgi:putative endonuclease
MWKKIENYFSAKLNLTPRQWTGLWGERQAARYLAGKGYKIIGKRFRIGPKDEIDLIAREGDALIFIEVKTRANEAFARPLAAVGRAKQYNQARAAVRYLKRLKTQPASFRFDVVEIIGKPGKEQPLIRHVENAFALPKYFRVP